MPLQIDLQVETSLGNLPSGADFNHWAQVAWDESDAGVVLRVVDNEESQTLNRQYRAKDYPTNVLSFPYDPPPVPLEADEVDYLGDLIMCAPVVLREAQEQGKTLSQHWAHLLIHGLLHLQGYDHITDTEAEEMEGLEIQLLAKLGFPNPYQ